MIVQNGRRYHAFREGEYFAVRSTSRTWRPLLTFSKPNDEREQIRMDLVGACIQSPVAIADTHSSNTLLGLPWVVIYSVAPLEPTQKES